MPVTHRSGKPGEIPVTSESIQQYGEEMQKVYARLGYRHIWHGFSCDDFKYESAATPPTCPESCKICSEQFVPPASRNMPDVYEIEMHSDPVATSTIKDLVGTTLADYDYIQNKIETHGNAIVKRWLKKNLTKRKELLRNAMPNIPMHRHSDLRYEFEDISHFSDMKNGRMSMERQKKLSKRKRDEDLFLLPFLNLESMGEDPRCFLALLHHRTSVHPREWIPFDKDVVQRYFRSGTLKTTAYNPHAVLICGGTFGSLVQWNKEAGHRWDIIGYPLARQIFRMQSKISKFLRSMVGLLLDHASSEAPRGRNEWDRLESASFKSQSCFVAKSAYTNQAYAPAPTFDIDRMRLALTNRLEASLDEVLLVQADPLYMRHLLDQTQKAKFYSTLKRDQQAEVLFLCPLWSMLHHDIWDSLCIVAATLPNLSIKCELRNGAVARLPGTYETALRSLEATLKVSFYRKINEITGLIVASPAFQHHFENGQQITDPMVAFHEDPLFWGLIELSAQNTRKGLRTASECITFIEEHLSKASKRDKARLDQTLYDRISDIAAMDEALTAIRSHKHYTCLPDDVDLSEQICFDNPLLLTSLAFKQFLSACFERPDIHEALRTICTSELSAQRGTAEKFAQNELLFEKSSKYWQLVRSCIDEQIKKRELPFLGAQVRRRLDELSSGQAYIFQSEQDAIERLIEAKGKSALSANVEGPTFSEKATRPEYYKGKTFAKNAESRSKTKSRPEHPAVDALTEKVTTITVTDTTNATSSAASQLIGVRAKSIEFFNRMFSSTDLTGGRTKWVASMVDAGCSATHGGGSAVTFEVERHRKGSIVLHKPHPDTTIDPIMLRLVGKRITRRLGWDQGTFVEREKEEA